MWNVIYQRDSKAQHPGVLLGTDNVGTRCPAHTKISDFQKKKQVISLNQIVQFMKSEILLLVKSGKPSEIQDTSVPQGQLL